MDMVVKIMQAGVPTQFDLEKYSTPLLRHWREKGRKRTANEAFLKTADALVDLDLSPRIKRVVRRPPPALTIYVRRESEKAYNAIMLEEITTENLKVAVAMKYNTPPDTINSFKLRCKEGPSSEIDDKAVSEFTDEDTFLISLDYNAEKGLCNVVLESS
ncbi:grainyhead-like protein 1 homolog [Acropora muricata]|uniref:grainyhead-like protein 1 homolog n=1 Tax=Acropora millepora TaxID=45264 RepID=UPI001CF5D8C0|nr:grainyhead-like protein 1 homolog [Acropora millepora]